MYIQVKFYFLPFYYVVYFLLLLLLIELLLSFGRCGKEMSLFAGQ